MPDRARCRLSPKCNRVEQRRLARAVRSDDAEALTRIEFDREAVDEGAVSDLDPDIGEFDDGVAESRRRTVQCQPVVSNTSLDGGLLQGFGGSNASLGLARAGGCTSQQPLLLAPGEVLANCLGLVGGIDSGVAAVEVPAIATIVQIQAAAVDFEDPGGDRIEHVSVVGYAQQATLECAKAFFEPVDRIDIQMVGWFVEHEQVGGRDQRTGERHPALFSAAHHLHPIAGAVAQAKAVKYRGGLPGVADGLERRDILKHRSLRQGCDLHATFYTDGAAVGLDGARRNAEQR